MAIGICVRQKIPINLTIDPPAPVRIREGHAELDGGDKVGHQIRQHGAEKDPDIATIPARQASFHTR
jgi:hypothetical protein